MNRNLTGGLEPAVRKETLDIRRLLAEKEAATPWVGVTFQNSWVNAGTYGAVKYRRKGDEVQIRGRMANGTLSVTCFTLPAGFRPPLRFQMPAVGPGGSAAVLDVDSNGECRPFASGNTSFDIMVSFSVTP